MFVNSSIPRSFPTLSRRVWSRRYISNTQCLAIATVLFVSCTLSARALRADDFMEPERVSAPVSSPPSAQQDSPPWLEHDESSIAVAPRLMLTSGGGLGAGIDFGYFVASGIGVGSTFSAYHFDNGAEWYCGEDCFRSIVTSTAFSDSNLR